MWTCIQIWPTNRVSELYIQWPNWHFLDGSDALHPKMKFPSHTWPYSNLAFPQSMGPSFLSSFSEQKPWSLYIIKSCLFNFMSKLSLSFSLPSLPLLSELLLCLSWIVVVTTAFTLAKHQPILLSAARMNWSYLNTQVWSHPPLNLGWRKSSF